LYSKDYYEPARPEVLSAFPEGIRSVLSIGCGWGSTESHLAEKGLCVTAIPLDPVIPGGAEASDIEIIHGSLASACRQLAGRKFDCLLISNLLHLVPNPAETLSSYAALLTEDGSVIALTPNMARLSAIWKLLRGDASYAVPGTYESTGVHRVSRGVLQKWFRSVGMKIETIIFLRPKDVTKTRRLAAWLLQPWMADEFVVVARKHTDSQKR
jgi:2-polyprenyl-3-methyl-5-hydroxy-6-metoxy-1,4-benzoquinol methylase